MMAFTESRPPAGGIRQRLLADDGTVVAAEHVPSPRGGRELAIVVVHGFMASAGHPRTRRIAGWLRDHGGVILLDLRGHGRSRGVSTLGWQEARDVDAAVNWARALGYARVATVGFSLGAAVVLRHAALYGGVDAVVAVSGPGEWYFLGTPRMRLLHRLILAPAGRLLIRLTRRTRVTRERWAEPLPLDPAAAAATANAPVLVVHGERDDLLPVDHARRVSEAAGDRGTLWVLPQFGHAEAAIDAEITHRIGDWVEDACRR
jgi:pimeloyl-ACP methyl ester carboxylesterase